MKSRKSDAVAIPDLLDLGSRPAINQALARLTRTGQIMRTGRGLYAIPRYSRLLKINMAPPVHVLVKAWARQQGVRVVLHGAHAANMLGLSTQVPVKLNYFTDGRTQTITLDGVKVRLINRGPRTMRLRGELATMIFQALRYLTPKYVHDDHIARLQGILRPKDRKDLKYNLRYAPEWMRPMIQKLIEGEASS